LKIKVNNYLSKIKFFILGKSGLLQAQKTTRAGKTGSRCFSNSIKPFFILPEY